jgi:hypothetical protein
MTLTADLLTQLGKLRGFQEFTSTTDPSTALAQDYTFKLTLNGSSFNSGNDITVTLTAAETFTSIASKIQTAINAITAASVTVFKDSDSGKIRVYSALSTSITSTVSLLAPTAGSSLLTLLGGVDTAVVKPRVLDGTKIGEPKSTAAEVLPLVIIIEGPNSDPLASLNQGAKIQKTTFVLRLWTANPTQDALFTIELERLVNSKSMAGGWWKFARDDGETMLTSTSSVWTGQASRTASKPAAAGLLRAEGFRRRE